MARYPAEVRDWPHGDNPLVYELENVWPEGQQYPPGTVQSSWVAVRMYEQVNDKGKKLDKCRIALWAPGYDPGQVLELGWGQQLGIPGRSFGLVTIASLDLVRLKAWYEKEVGDARAAGEAGQGALTAFEAFAADAVRVDDGDGLGIVLTPLVRPS